MRRARTLPEKYRAHRFGQIRGQDAVVRRLMAMLRRDGFEGGAFWIEGPSGTGKTSIALGIGEYVRIKRDAWNYTELDGHKCSVERVRELDGQTAAAGLFADQWRLFIVNEAHLLEKKAVGAWLTLLERWPYKWIVVFTSTEDHSGLFGPQGKPLIDRCVAFKLTNQGLAPVFAKLAHRIATREGLNGRPVDAYEAALKRPGMKNSMRALLAKIEKRDFCDES